VGGDFLTGDGRESFHTRGERIFSPGDILGGRKYHGTPVTNLFFQDIGFSLRIGRPMLDEVLNYYVFLLYCKHIAFNSMLSDMFSHMFSSP